MPEQTRSFGGHAVRRALMIGLTILPYFLVTTCGALAVAIVAKTSARTVSAKFNTVIHALKRH